MVILCFTLALFIPVSIARASDYLNEIVRANGLYSEKRYTEAARSYEGLISKGVRNGYLYYNLGNTYIRLGKVGLGISNYIRARKWIPRDENLEANLKFAIQQTRDQIDLPTPGFLNTFFFWNNNLNTQELIFFTMGLNFIFFVTLSLWIYFPSLVIVRNTILCILLLSFLSIGVKLGTESELNFGVVLAERVDVKSGRAEDAVTLFQLHEGALVKVTDHLENWVEVRLNDEQKGWVPEKSVDL